METVSWYAKEEDWILKRSIIFSKNLVRLTFIEVERMLKLLGNVQDIYHVLDLCCGIGRHSIQLARSGFNVTGVDITKPYLDIARENAEKANLDIHFIQSDMRDFCRPNSFDLIVNLCTSFGYLNDIEEDIKVLRNMYISLNTKGRFVIEILGKEVIAATFRKHQEYEFDGYKVIANCNILDDWSMLELKRTIIKDAEEQEITAYHRLYSATELKNYLRKIGFKHIQVFGDFAGLPYDSDAKAMILICEK